MCACLIVLICPAAVQVGAPYYLSVISSVLLTLLRMSGPQVPGPVPGPPADIIPASTRPQSTIIASAPQMTQGGQYVMATQPTTTVVASQPTVQYVAQPAVVASQPTVIAATQQVASYQVMQPTYVPLYG